LTSIGNVDQVLLLLREQLARTGKDRRASGQKAVGRNDPVRRPLDRVRALAAMDSLAEEDLRRAVVRGLLTEEFGEGLSNDPALHAVTDRVIGIIRETPGGPELLQRAIVQLKEGAA
jgi:hypothetical protein